MQPTELSSFSINKFKHPSANDSCAHKHFANFSANNSRVTAPASFGDGLKSIGK